MTAVQNISWRQMAGLLVTVALPATGGAGTEADPIPVGQRVMPWSTRTARCPPDLGNGDA